MGAAENQGINTVTFIPRVNLCCQPCHLIINPPLFGKGNKHGTLSGNNLDVRIDSLDCLGIGTASDCAGSPYDPDLAAFCNGSGTERSRLYHPDYRDGELRLQCFQRYCRRRIAGNNQQLYIALTRKEVICRAKRITVSGDFVPYGTRAVSPR